MEFRQLAEIYSRCEKTAGRLEMTDIISDFLKNIDDADLWQVILFLRGTPFPSWEQAELGISDKLMNKVISQVSGVSDVKLIEKIRDVGDIGQVAEEVLVNKSQTTLFSQALTVEKVASTMRRMVTLVGKGSQDKKLAYISELLSNASALESRFLVRLILGQLRIGVGDGVIRDSIAKAFEVEPTLVESAYNMRPDWGVIAQISKNEGAAGLLSLGLELGKPVKVMLAQKAKGLNVAIEELGEVVIEYKYDGARVQIHKDGNSIRLFTRRLEEVTKQFPEIVETCVEKIKVDNCVIEGEIVAYDVVDRRPLPFQNLSRRIKRKYDIKSLAEKIPVEVNLFDMIYSGGKALVDLPFNVRRAKLIESVIESDIVRLAESIVTSNIDEASEFYRRSLDLGHEGVMLKVLDAPYKPGSRVGYMYKVKPVMESLDLVVTGATWGEGRRAQWLGSYLLSVYDSESGSFLEIGRMATGLTDDLLIELTELFKPLITASKGVEVEIKPTHVFEVAYEEIQKSPTYSSGYAMRFPRLVRVRPDLGPDEADTLMRVETLLQNG